jgi:hypothetical protein
MTVALVIPWILAIRDNYIVKGGGPPSFHLGCNYQQFNDNKLKIGTKSCIEECMKRVIDERDLGCNKVPMSPTLKPELD